MALEKVFATAYGMQYLESLIDVSHDGELTMQLYRCTDWQDNRIIGYTAEAIYGGTVSKPDLCMRGPLCRDENTAMYYARIFLINKAVAERKKFENMVARLRASIKIHKNLRRK